jgi:hypothetical protein
MGLNTPDGRIVNLRTAERLPPDPAALCSKSTAVAPDFGGPCPEWRRFLAEATGNDEELQSYLQRLAGYCLTGVTLEQQFTIFHGPGGHGKGTFKSAIEGRFSALRRRRRHERRSSSHRCRSTRLTSRAWRAPGSCTSTRPTSGRSSMRTAAEAVQR